MAEQLRLINARLSVRPDHSDDPTHFEFEGVAGERLMMSGDHISLASPQVVTETTDGTARNVEMRFSSRQQMDQWLAEQRAAGNHVDLGQVREQRVHQTNTQHIRLSFGGRELFRALGYVSMTFLVHYFPKLGRGKELLNLKNYCLNDIGEDMAWWEPPDLMNDFEQNPFRFGHTIAITVSSDSQEAYAKISLFSALNFSVFLGIISTKFSKTKITFIDPMADRPPNDIILREVEGSLFSTDRQAVAHARLSEIIENGRAQESFQLLFNRISRYNFDKELTPAFERIQTAIGSEASLSSEINALVEQQSQRVLNLMRHAIAPIRDGFAANPELNFFAARLDPLLVGDHSSIDGLGPQASNALSAAKEALKQELSRLARSNDLSFEQFFLILSGGPGAALAAQATLAPLIADL